MASRIRRHLGQHKTVADLPLLTESARVTNVAAMDHNRSSAVVNRLLETLDDHGSADWARRRPTSDEAARRLIQAALDDLDHRSRERPLTQYLAESHRAGPIMDRMDDLQGRYLQPYPSLLVIDVDPSEPFDFIAGQYLGVRFEGVSRAYSIASSPTHGEVEFCVRRVPGGRMTSELAADLDVGDTLTLRGPYGDLALEPPSHRDLVFLATGTGVAPFKSMIDYCFDAGLDRFDGDPRDVWLFLGAAWRDELPYREAFEQLDRERPNFHFVPTLSRERHLAEWPGETDYVQHTLVKYVDDASIDDLPPALDRYREASPTYPIDATLDPTSMEVYGCGVNAMVESLVVGVDALGVPAEHTQFEGFG